MGLTIELAYPSHVTKSNTQWLICCSQSPQIVGNRFNTKNGAHKITNVKNTTPNTLVAFCSRRMMRPWRDEFRDITLELREWCDRTVPQRLNKHGVDLFELLLLLTFNIFETVLSILRVVLMPVATVLLLPNPFKILLWLRSVADRRSADVIVGTCFGAINVVWWPPKLEPRRDFWLFRVSHVTTVFDFVCGGVIEKLSFRMGAGVGDVAGVGVVELHIGWWWLGAANKCSVGAELPICNAEPTPAAVAADGLVMKFRRDVLFDAIAIGLLLIISGDNSSGFNSDTIRTSAFRCACDFDEPKYGHVHGGGKLISFNFLPFESFRCCFSCKHNWLFDFSVEFWWFFRFFIISVSSGSPSSSVSVSIWWLWCWYTVDSISLSTFDCSSNPMSSCSMRGKLLHRLRKFNSELCESLRSNPLDDHVEWEARRLLLLRRAGDIGL